MPSLDDNIEDLVSSADPTLDESEGKNAEFEAVSSTADGESGDNDLLNVVRDVVKERQAPEAASPSADGLEDKDQGDAKAPDDEAFSDVPFNQHPRFKQLLRQRDTYKQGAERYNNVVEFLDRSHLSSEEAADGLIIMGLMKTNPREAWVRLQPTLQKLLVAAGEVPSPQLQARVNSGELSAAAALEISRAEANAKSTAAQRQWDEEYGRRTNAQAQTSAVTNAVSDWEQDRIIKDPNFEAKRPLLEKEILYLHAKEGVPNTAEGVREQLKKAYAEVNKAFKPPTVTPAPAPQRTAIKPVTGGQKAGNQAPATANMSTLDIIRSHRRA